MASSANPEGTSVRPLRWVHLGRCEYRHALTLQMERWEAVRDGHAPDTIFTVEHLPVITLGKRAADSDILVDEATLQAQGIDLIRIDRGGEATWHGPGQLVIYPIIHTTRLGIGASDLVRGLADVIRSYLESLGVHSAWDNEHPGLWVTPPDHATNPWATPAKITAVGMKIQSGVSRHGAALNLYNDLHAWSLFVPCGMPTARSTSVRNELPRDTTSIESASEAIVQRFAERFHFHIEEEPPPAGSGHHDAT